jgi:hypothetical protein
MQQQLSLLCRLVVVNGAQLVLADVQAFDIQFPFVKKAIRIVETGFASPQRFYFGTGKHQTCGKGLFDKVFVIGLFVADGHVAKGLNSLAAKKSACWRYVVRCFNAKTGRATVLFSVSVLFGLQ